MASGTGEDGPAILALGSINADFQTRVSRRPELSETLIGRDFLRVSGGKAANVAFLTRKLGHPARLLGHVGQDDLAEQALAPLKRAGVDLTWVKAVEGAETAVSMITVPPDGKKGIVLCPNANDEWADEDVAAVEEAIATAPAGSVLVVDAEVPPFVVHAAVAAAGRRRFARVLDPSPADQIGEALLGDVEIVVPNATEAETLTGIAVRDAGSAAEAARRILEAGAAACVKLPDGGCLLAEPGGGMHRIESTPVEVVDTTGAGDAFAGALAVALAEGRAMPEVARFAVAAAEHAVTGWGSQPAYPERAQLDAGLDRVRATAYAPDEH